MMNPAIRYASSKTLPQNWVQTLILRANFTLPVMLSAVVISALSVIYSANLVRNLNADLQRALNERQQIHLEWEQLLLERGTLVRQARVQQVAENTLNMITPGFQSTVNLPE